MDITPRLTPGRTLIKSYGGGGFTISGARVQGSVLLFPDRLEAWDVADFAEVTMASLAPVIDADPKIEVLLLGCGAQPSRLPAALQRDLRAAGLAVDIMTTAAACRTFNVLAVEDRRVAAALIAVV